MEAEVALGALLARFPGLSLAVPPEALRWRPVSLMNGLESLPVRLA
jgi:cytochrome P450